MIDVSWAAFESQVEQVLRLSGYAIERDVLVRGTQIDLVATRHAGLVPMRYLVECTDQTKAVPIDYVKEKAASLLNADDEGYITCVLLVSRRGFSAPARAFAHDRPKLVLKTLAELEAQLVDFSPYRDWYSSNFERSIGRFAEGQLHDHYVETSVETLAGKRVAISKAVVGWLADKSNNVLFLLGDYGAGKTSFLRQFTYDLLTDPRGAHSLLPLLIPLRDYRSAINLRQVITDTLINDYGVPLRSFQAFERYCSLGRVLLLFDGFDEMAARADRRTLFDCLTQVFILAETGSKLIVTCRSNFFRSHRELLDLLKTVAIEVPEEGDPDVLPLGRHGEVLTITPLDSDQIRQFVLRRYPTEEDANAFLTQMGRIHDLSDLSRRPVLLDMILSTLPHLAAGGHKVNSAALYESYTERWTRRDEWRVALPGSVRHTLCEELAWGLLSNGETEISHGDLRACLELVLEGVAKTGEQLEEFLNDIQTCSFLTRVGSGDTYAFAHKSFIEFFVARKTSRALIGAAELDLVESSPSDYPGAWPAHGPGWETSGDIVGASIAQPRAFLLWSELAPTVETRLSRAGLRATIASPDEVTEASAALRGLLAQKVSEVFSVDDGSEGKLPFGVTPEIATFVIEWLEMKGTTLAALLDQAGRGKLGKLLPEIMRSAQCPGYFQEHVRTLASRIRRTRDARLQAALAGALVQTRHCDDAAALRGVLDVMSSEVAAYLCSEILEVGSTKAKAALRQLDQAGELTGLASIIGLVSRQDEFPPREYAEAMAGRMDAILGSGMDATDLLELVSRVMVSGGGLVDFAAVVVAGKLPVDVKLNTVRFLESSHLHPSDLRMIRMHARDSRVKSQLQRLETMQNADPPHAQRLGRRSRRDWRATDRLWSALSR